MAHTKTAVRTLIPSQNSYSPASAAAQSLIDAIRRANHLPISPPIAFQLSALLRSPHYTCEAVVDLVRLDIDLTTQVLRLCNSVEFRGSHGATSLQESVLRLGNGNIAHKVMSLTVGRLFTVRKSAYCPDPNVLWRRSVQCGLAARYLVAHCDGFKAPADVCFTAGLLHDLGKMVINFAEDRQVDEIVYLIESDGMFGADAELEVLGADHAEIGATLLDSWQIPSEITTAVRFHHTPEFEHSGLANLLHVANACAQVSDEYGAWESFESALHPHTLSRLRLSLPTIRACWEDVLHDVNAIESFMWS